jgi:transposase
MIQYVGIDVSAKTLHTALQCGPHLFEGTFDNTPAGHRQLLDRLQKPKSATQTRVVLESTGIYGLDVALRLAESPKMAVMVANPRAVKAFAKASLQRGKTDSRDARLLLQFAQRMDFRPWQPPTLAVLQLRQLVRRIAELTVHKAAQKNRRHALQQTHTALPALLEDIDELTVALDQRIVKLEEAALALLEDSDELAERYELLLTVPGVGRKSALRLLGELAVLPADMDVRQWVAHCGLDPQPVQSGSSVHRRAQISKAGNKHLRHALFLPALTAARCDPQLQAFRDKLVARGRKRIQAIVALMRKLLHAIYGMFRTRTPFDVTKLLPA